MKRFTIIPITEKYIEKFWKTLDSVAREKRFLAFLEAPSLEITRNFVLKNIQEEWPHLIALEDETLIGWCDITSLDRPVFSHVGTLGMGILAPYRGQSIGKALLKAALEKAHAKGLTRIELTVRKNNINAINLYKQFGFVIEGFHKHAVKINDSYEDHLSMALIN